MLLACTISPLSYAIRPVVVLTGGLINPLDKGAQSLSFANTFFDYHPQNYSSKKGLFGGFLGMEYSLNPVLSWQFGLAFYQSGVFKPQGEEIQTPMSNPNAINAWRYQYKVVNRQLLAENKLSYSLQTSYHPYVLAGIGAGFNRAYHFQAIPQNSGEVATAIFTSHQNNSLIFNAGFGVDVDITKQVRLGGGYRFGNFGAYDLGKGTLDTGPGGSVFYLPALKSPQTFSQELLLQLTYIL